MSIESLERALQVARGVLEKVEPSQLGNPTPCDSWNVRELINHLVGAPEMSANAFAGEPGRNEGNAADGDFVHAYDESSAHLLEVVRAPGALDGDVQLPWGAFPRQAFLAMTTMEQFAHGWDLARATGQSTDLDPALADELLASASISDQSRGENGKAPFTALRQAPASASAADKLAAYLGRAV